MKGLLSKLYKLSRAQKFSILILMDIIFVVMAYFSAIALSTNTFWIPESRFEFVYLGLAVIGSIACFYSLNLYKSITRFINLNFIITLVLATISSTITFGLLGNMIFSVKMSLVQLVLYFNFTLLSLGGFRYIIKSLFYNQWYADTKSRVIIYGAGSAGQQLATSLQNGQQYIASAFIDDNPAIQGTSICGIKVHPLANLTVLIEKTNPEKILLAIPSASKLVRSELISKIERLSVPVQTIPGMSEIVEGKLKIDDFQDVEIDDLLGRDTVPPKDELLTENITNKIVMVTGAGGSIGSELCRQIIKLKPRELLLVEVSEFAIYSIDKELSEINNINQYGVTIKPFLGSVQNQNRLDNILKTIKVDTLYHAAAYKHVPMVEYNVIEGVRNNVFGTYRTAKAAIDNGVSTFILISTDKAVRPTNVMGATKRMAELVLQGLAKVSSGTRFSMVRFGNVLGSSGSVVPLFKKQIRNGGPITVTHPDIIRYFMTIPEAALLVIQAGAMAKGGDVFVLDMGDPVKISDLASKMVRLMGLEVKDEKNPDGDIEITYSGLRPGEKLYEELLIGDNVEGTNHPRILTANEVYLPWDEMGNLLKTLDRACSDFDHQIIRNILLNAPTGFNPSDGICDLIWEIENTENVVRFPKLMT